MRTFERFDLLGSHVDIIEGSTDLHSIVESAIASSKRTIIGNHNLHSLYLCHKDKAMRDYYELADYVHTDGMGVVLLGKLLKLPLHREHRITYLDYFAELLPLAVKRGWRVFYLGAKPKVVASGAMRLRQRYPGLHFRFAHGYFDHRPGSPDSERVLQAIASYRPHILLIGLGMPTQEQWVYHHAEHIQANAIFNAGGFMDYIAGAVPTPPRWMGRMGLEWLFRLVAEPRRLAKRYLVEPWYVLRVFWAVRRKQQSLIDGV